MKSFRNQIAQARVWGAGLVLIVLVWFVFGQTVGYEFINCDDDIFVYQNPLVLRGLQVDTVFRALTGIRDTFYYPLTVLSFMADAEIHGMQASGFHFTNVLLHTLSVLLLFSFLMRLSGSFWESVLIAALFAVHPLQVEAVAWVTARKDALSGVFFMLTLHAYLCYVRAPFSLLRYSTVFFLFLCGLMAKPMLVTMPALFLLLDWWPLKRFDRRCMRIGLEKVPLFILSAVFSSIPFFAAGSLKSGTPVVQPSLLWRAGNAVISYAVYIRQFFFPYGLGMPYPKYDLHGWMLLISLTVLAAITVVLFYLRKKRPVLLFGWLWYLGMLFPVAGLIRFLGVAQADRFVYLPLIGLSILTVRGAARLPIPEKYKKAGACAVIILLAVTAHFQVRHWRNNLTLWTRALEVAGESTLAYVNLGVVFAKEGEFAAAETCFQRTLQLDSEDQEALYNLGLLRIRSQRLEEGECYLKRVVALNPDRFDANRTLGAVLIAQRKAEAGIEYTLRALRVHPDDEGTRRNLDAAKKMLAEEREGTL